MRAAGLERIRSLAGSPCNAYQFRAPSSIIRNICNFRSPHGILRRRSRPEAARSSPSGYQHRTCIRSQPVHRLLQVHPGLSPARLLHNFCWYIEYLAKYHYSAGVISKNISHLRTYFRMAGLDITPLMHCRVQLALRAVAMTIRQQSNTKLPVTPLILKRVLPFIRSQPDALPVSLGLLIMFMGFLRQSSVAPPSCAAFDYTRHLTRADASLSTAGLAITIKWSKTIQRAADLKTVLLPATSDSDLCPVRAYTALIRGTGPALPRAPLLTFKDGNPITTRLLARRWTQALQATGLSPLAYSLHSLRKGGGLLLLQSGRRGPQ